MKKLLLVLMGLLLGASPPTLGADMSVDAKLRPSSENAFVLTPGVVVDATGPTIYLWQPDGGIAAVAVASGQLLWRSDAAAKPLGLFGDALVAQAASGDALHVVTLDTLDGAIRGKGFELELPSGIAARVDDGLGSKLAVRTAVRGHELLVHWEHTQRYAKPIRPARGESMQHIKVGAYRLDHRANRAIAIDPALFAAAKPALPDAVASWSRAAATDPHVVRAGDVYAATVVDRSVDPERIVLHRWNAGTGAPLPEVTLLNAPHIVQFHSADQRHLLVSERLAPGKFKEYTWSVYSLETGGRLGQFAHQQSVAHFFVAGDRLVFVERPYGRRVDGEWRQVGRALKSVRLAGPAQEWARPLRDPSYRGPYRP